MQFSQVQAAQIAAAAAAALGKDKEEDKDSTTKREQVRAQQNLLTQMKKSQEVSRTEGAKKGFLA
jgi:hypothetical protein